MSTSSVLPDVRAALRSLRRTPGFALVAVITLGLGIGANTSMFSILNGYMLEPLPYPKGEELDRIYRATPQDQRGGVSAADYLDLRREAGGYGEVAAYASADMGLAENGRPALPAAGLRVSANLFATLGTGPSVGRSFREDEEIAGNHRVVVISHRFWQNRFGGDAHIVGRSVRIDGEPHEIVGVLPETFSDWRHLTWVDVFRPLGFTAQEIADRSATSLRLVGRRSGSPDDAGRFIAAFGSRLAKAFPAIHADATWRAVSMESTFLPREGQLMVGMLIGLSGFGLPIACPNLANLLHPRTMARARELAMRTALGASRIQVLRPLIFEALLLALAGGVCAVLVAGWAFDWMAVASRSDSGTGMRLTLNWHVLAWAFGACLFTALAFGVAPALYSLRLDINGTLKSGSRGLSAGRGRQTFRSALIVGQFALAMVLLAGAALFVRGIGELNDRRYGWQSDQLVTGSIVLPSSRYPGDDEITEFQKKAVQTLEAVPGVASASFSYEMPFFGLNEPRKYVVSGRELPEPGREPVAHVNGVSPRYFETVGTRLIEGRVFDDRDTFVAPRVVVINQSMARGLFGNASPLGKRVARAGAQDLQGAEIVGVVSDVRSVAPDANLVDYQLYQPEAQEPRRASELAVRVEGVAPSSVVESIRTAMATLDADLPVRTLRTGETAVARANYGLGVIASLLSALALLGLGLASLGVYGIVARTVAQRTSEFGIRIALGAQSGDITRLVLSSGAKLALLGSAIGLVGAVGVSRLIVMAFPSIPTTSVPVLAAVTLLLIGIAQVACYLPARSASRVNPTETLRAE